MKNLNHLLMLSLFANFAFGETSPNYKVTQIANPPVEVWDQANRWS
jgi:hypothetical protein